MLTPAKTLSLVAALCALLAFPAAAGATGLSSSASSLLKEINHVRAAHGLKALSYDTRLARAARAHTLEMANADQFTHGSFGTRMRIFNLHGHLGENLAWGVGSYGTSKGIVRAWLASPSHRANLLSPGFRRIGLGDRQGRFLGASGARIVTADFSGS
jgi:uncharacterized protein YkwD